MARARDLAETPDDVAAVAGEESTLAATGLEESVPVWMVDVADGLDDQASSTYSVGGRGLEPPTSSV